MTNDHNSSQYKGALNRQINVIFDHEKLDVYRLSIEFMAIAIQLSDKMPRGYASLSDQLKRASWSIPLNIAEGCGKTGINDKKKFYTIARGSAMECAAIIDICHILKTDAEHSLEQGKILLLRIVSMLTKMCQQRDALRKV